MRRVYYLSLGNDPRRAGQELVLDKLEVELLQAVYKPFFQLM
jgi:hypothetical protein